MPLLVGTDGVQKMSQSLGNYVGHRRAAGREVRQADVGPRRADRAVPAAVLAFLDPAEADARREGPGGRVARAERREAPAGARGRRPVPRGRERGERAEERFERVHREHELPEEVPDGADPAGPRREDGSGLAPAARSSGVRPRGLELAGAAVIEQGGVRLDGRGRGRTRTPRLPAGTTSAGARSLQVRPRGASSGRDLTLTLTAHAETATVKSVDASVHVPCRSVDATPLFGVLLGSALAP